MGSGENNLIPYALKGKRLVHVDQVENGLGCGCICPECSEPLEAKNNGKVREHHFSHAPGRNECRRAYERTLHMLAEQVFKDLKQLHLPDYRDRHFGIQNFDDVVLEKRVNYGDDVVVPDAIGTRLNHELFVEFLVTHAVDDKKLEILIRNNVSCVEVDLRRQALDEDKLRKFLLSKSSDIKWLNAPIMDQAKVQENKEEAAEQSLITDTILPHQNVDDSSYLEFDNYNYYLCPWVTNILQRIVELSPGNRYLNLKKLIELGGFKEDLWPSIRFPKAKYYNGCYLKFDYYESHILNLRKRMIRRDMTLNDDWLPIETWRNEMIPSCNNCVFHSEENGVRCTYNRTSEPCHGMKYVFENKKPD